MMAYLNVSSLPTYGDGVYNSSLLVENSTSTTEVTPTMAPVHNSTASSCQRMLYKDFGESQIRIWDVAILIPNSIFLAFLVFKSKKVIKKLKRTNSPMFTAFYWLVCMVAVIGVVRCIVSMTVNAALPSGDIADQILWLVLRFFLLATELSVLVFGLAVGHLERRASVQVVLLVTFSFSVIYSSVQGCLEFLLPDQNFHVVDTERQEEYDLFGHGGMIFWFCTSTIFVLVYGLICLLPLCCYDRLALPRKPSFYAYCASLAILNLIQAAASAAVHYGVKPALCFVNVTSFVYFTLFAPYVYFVFLREFFRSLRPPNILFSYKPQQDDEEDDEQSVQLPEQTGPEPIPDMAASIDSTHFDALSPNPLYDTDLPFSGGWSKRGNINTDDDLVIT